MIRNPYQSAVYIFIARAPFIILAVAAVWFLFYGVLKLEERAFGTEYLLQNGPNQWKGAGERGADHSELVAEAEAAANSLSHSNSNYAAAQAEYGDSL